MKKNYNLAILLILSIAFVYSCIKEKEYCRISEFPELRGQYLGQELPVDTPELFAPNLISTAMHTRDLAIAPDGKEIFFCVSSFGYNLIFQTKEINGKWTEPEPAEFIQDYKHMYFEPHLTPDGNRLLFLSDMPNKPGTEITQDIWAVDKKDNGWGTPYNLGEPVNTNGSEFFPSSTLDGTLYFTRAEKGTRIHYIYRSKMIDGKYSDPEKLGPEVNCGTNRFNAYIDPKERFIIVPAMGMKDSYGGTDYYIVFRDENDNWSSPINMGEKVNTENGREFSPYISPDGNYFFFMSSRTKKEGIIVNGKPSFKAMLLSYRKPQNGNSDIYWMKSDFIYDLKNNVRKLGE